MENNAFDGYEKKRRLQGIARQVKESIGMDKITISTDKDLLNLDIIINYLQKTYWANKRSSETIKISIDNSICFGVYLNKSQIGFARVVTDCSVFAYLMDVFILEEFNGLGYGMELLDYILSHKDLIDIETFKLGTHDAHEFYKKRGFRNSAHPEFQMEKLLNNEN
ncbi:GNAT family N-acetyltransferase [Lutimonas sp.]|uniref:GNAT family N-acetyltransferase n=1 Tax=Lutimonas sp. TaxID=1872403 RepID=UPI003D9B5B66